MSLRPCRSQADMLQPSLSKRSASRGYGKSLTRQEFRSDVDVNTVVRRYQAGDIPLRPAQYGEQDFDMDTTQAHLMMRDVGQVFQQLPPDLRKKYPDMLALARAIQNGEVVLSDKSKAERQAAAAAERKAALDAEVAAAVAAMPKT
ncbi:internal scaffolding protein [Microviridae sp.]|nr:internal scaffolding protein [Microviridae sp.]